MVGGLGRIIDTLIVSITVTIVTINVVVATIITVVIVDALMLHDATFVDISASDEYSCCRTAAVCDGDPNLIPEGYVVPTILLRVYGT